MKAKNKRGSVLVVALWSVLLLTMLAVILGADVRQKLVFLARIEERSRGRLAAEAGIRKAQALMAQAGRTGTVNYHSFSDLLGNNRAFRDVPLAGDTVTVSYSVVSPVTGEAAVLYGLRDEASKLNINVADVDALQRLFEALAFDRSVAQDLANSIVDWRDDDSYLSAPIGSAESSYYRSLDRPYEARNAPFELLAELMLVKGVDEKIFASLADFVTIYGNGMINVNTASWPVLIAAGLSPQKAERLIAYRDGEDRVPGTEDDRFFSDISLVVPALSRFYDLSPADISEFSSAAGRMIVSSRLYTAHSRAFNSRKQPIGEATAVLDTGGIIVFYEEH